MFSHTLLRFALLLAPLSALLARNVYVMPPNDGVTRTVTIYNASDLNRLGTVQAATDAFTAVTMPNGNKTYIIGRSATNTVTVVNNATLQVSQTINIPSGARTAIVTPDSRRVVLLGANAGVMVFIDTGTDTVLQTVTLAGTGSSLVSAPDSGTIYALLGSVSQVVAVNPFSYQVNSLALPTQSADGCGMGWAPNGYLYANAQNRLYEIDPRTLTVNLNTSSQYNGTGGNPSFTADGSKAVFPLLNTSFGASIIVVELRRSAVIGSGINLQGLKIDELEVTTATAAIAYSRGGGALFSVNLLAPYSASPLGVSGLPGANLPSLKISNEVPNALYAFTAQGSTLYRLGLAQNSVLSQPLPNNAGPVVFSGPASTNAPAQMLVYNQSQIIGLLTVPAPLIVRVVDALGTPVAGAPVTFTSSNIFNIQPTPASVVTNGEGWAIANVTNPGVNAQFTVQASTTGQVTQVFTITTGAIDTGGGTGGGGTGTGGKLEIWDGNGLFAKSLAFQTQDMVVRVSDGNNNPVPGVTINWNITTGGGGSLANPTSITDEKGLARNKMSGKLMFGALQSFEQAAVTASTGTATVTFSVIQIANLIDGSSSPTSGLRFAPEPVINQVFPEDFSRPELVGPVGGTIKGVLKYRVRAGTGPFVGSPIPGVGISGTTGLTPDVGPVANCDPNQLSDGEGVVTCDLRFDVTSKLGTADPFTVTIGGLAPQTFQLRMTFGPPSKIEKVVNALGQDPDNQRGAPGTEIPRQLVARLSDVAGNLSTGATVLWEIVSGDGTLIGTVSRADARGLVSTGLRFGNTPGPIRVRVSVPSQPSVTPLVFTANVEVAVGALTKISGDSQAATINTSFDQPLVVEVRDGQLRLVPGAIVTFAANGGVVVPGTATTNAQGQASVTVTAGANPSQATVTASIAGFSVSFSLTVRPLTPTLTSLINNASGRADNSIAPCAQVNINGTNIVPNITGLRSSQSQFGRLPTTFEGVSVRINGIAAPIFWVFGGGGGGRNDTVAIQVPCEGLLPGSANIEVLSGSLAPGQLTVRSTQVAPGIFEDGEGTARQAIVLRPNGTRATSANPALAGERVTIIATGLGLVSPGTATNEPGTGGQRAIADIVIGLNDEGISEVTTEYAPGLLGVYYVSFVIPTNATRGPNRPLVIAASGADGNVIFSAPTSMDIR